MSHLYPLSRVVSLLTLLLCLAVAVAVAAAAANQAVWVGSWYSSPMDTDTSFSNATVRTVVHLTAGGERLRLRFTNEFGRTPLKIGRARVSSGAVSQSVTFNGQPGTLLSAGQSGASDPINLKMSAGAELVISVFYPEAPPQGSGAQQMSTAERDELVQGDATRDTALSPTGTPLPTTYFLTGVDIESVSCRGVIVVISDSTTAGGATKWPALLAQRLAAAGKEYGVLNAGMGGNRLVRDSQVPYGGPSALRRFDRDALDQPGVKYVIVYEGLADVGVGPLDGDHPHPATSAEITEGLRRLGERAHRRHVKLYVATLTPFEVPEGTHSGLYTPEKNRVRQEVNDWIRTSSEIDGYFDFELALKDPAFPNKLSAQFSSDLLHPNDAGQRALSEAINPSMFR